MRRGRSFRGLQLAVNGGLEIGGLWVDQVSGIEQGWVNRIAAVYLQKVLAKEEALAVCHIGPGPDEQTAWAEGGDNTSIAVFVSDEPYISGGEHAHCSSRE